MTTESQIAARILSDQEVEAYDLDSLPVQASIDLNNLYDLPPELREPVLISMAEQSGDLACMLALTDLYLIEKDQPELAKPWLDKMLAQDYLPAYASEAQMYMFGKYYQQDLDKAITLFERLAERYIAAEDYQQYAAPLAFCYLSLAQIYQAQQNIAMMMMHYFNALQLSDSETADHLANIFHPEIDVDPASKSLLVVLHCVFLTLAADFIHQRCDAVDDDQQRNIMLLNYVAKKGETLETIASYELTAKQSQQADALVKAWHDGDHQLLIEAVMAYVNGAS